MIIVLTFLLGLILLYFGGELLVKGSVAFSLRIRISTLVVGMTVVSFATSAPELFVSLQAVFAGSNDIAFGNVVGSNIANIALVLGITASIFRVTISNQTVNINYPFLLFVSLFFGLVLYFFDGIPRLLGLLFIVFLMFFIIYLIKKSREQNLKHSIEDSLLQEINKSSVFRELSFLFLGVLLLKYGADFLVDSSISIAKIFDISERVIAVTVVAIGTSIPELATSIIAAIKKEDNLAVGNLIGSNIFNILAVLGIVASIKEIRILDSAILTFDYVWMIGITFLLGAFIYLFSKSKISRFEGLTLVILYCIYLYSSI